MKGILLAGGSGTRLAPMTQVVTKQLLPLYDKPMIFYSLAALMRARLREVLIISTPRDCPMIEQLLGDGSHLGMSIAYAVQPKPEGIAQALIIAEEFLAGQSCCLMLGDNIFYGDRLAETLQDSTHLTEGGIVFAYKVRDPERYGVVEFDAAGQAISIEEKPITPKSRYAVTGIYFYDGQAPAIARSLTPSARGELEITDLNRHYLAAGQLNVVKLQRGTAWLDTGTPDALQAASQFVQIIEERQSVKTGCIEEIAFTNDWIDAAGLNNIIETRYPKNEYGVYLRELLD